MTEELKKKLKRESKKLDPVLRIGKNGLNESVMKEIIKQLTKKELIKIKFLQSITSKEEFPKMIEAILKETQAEIIDKIGFTISIYKKRPRKPIIQPIKSIKYK